MLTDRQRELLEQAWAPARARGVLGTSSIESLIAHAAGYLPAASVVLDRDGDSGRAVDLGTGAGVPGLLLALMIPSSRWWLVDAQDARVDLARRAVQAMGCGDRVTVVHGRAEELAHDPAFRGTMDLVTVRSFGDVSEVAECGGPLLALHGRLVSSVSEIGLTTWQSAPFKDMPLVLEQEWDRRGQRFVSVGLTQPVPASYPRRPARRRRDPLV